MFDLSGKKALVTGSTQGIGKAIAKLLAKQGATVYINGAKSEEKISAVVSEIPGSKPALVDLSKKDCADKMYNITGDVDILVLNASVQYKTEWDKITDDEIDAQINVNLKASYKLIQKYVQYMKSQKWGRVVTIGSVNQYNQHPELSIYGVTKAAQMKMVQNFAPLLAPFGITINNVAPGAIETPRNEKAFEDATFKKKVADSIPCGYIGKPEDISPAVLLLCSDEGRYITGAEIKIDGGMSL